MFCKGPILGRHHAGDAVLPEYVDTFRLRSMLNVASAGAQAYRNHLLYSLVNKVLVEYATNWRLSYFAVWCFAQKTIDAASLGKNR